MDKKIFVIFLLLKFSASQISFPDGNNPTTEEETTEEEMPPEEEMPEEEPTEPEYPTVIPETNPPTEPTGSLDICAAMNQCFDIGGMPIINMTGKMDVRVNNKGKAYNTTVGTNEQITTPLSPGVTVVVNSQASCPMSNVTEICTLSQGYKCGIAYSPLPGMPTKKNSADYIAYPWQGLVMRNDPVDKYTYYASGVLISHKHFMTVANKVLPFANQPSLIKVRLGEWNLAGTVKPFPPQEFDITDIVIHSYFDNATLAYNLAMLYFATFAPLGQYPNIGTACLPKDDLSYSGIYCMVAGWGKMSKISDTTFVLRDVDQPIIDPATCEGRLKNSILGKSYSLNSDTWLCAGGEVNKSNCDGDGGNPLVCNITGQWYVVGLASWAPTDQNCGLNPIPELYVNVATQVPWIQYVTSGLGRRFITTKRPQTTMRPTQVPTSKLGGTTLGTTTSTLMTTTQRKKIGITTTPTTSTVKMGSSPVTTTPEFDARKAQKGQNSTRAKVGVNTRPTVANKKVQATKPSGVNGKSSNVTKKSSNVTKKSSPALNNTTKNVKTTSTLKTTSKPKAG